MEYMVLCWGAGISGLGDFLVDSGRSELDAAHAATVLFGGHRSGARDHILPAPGVGVAQCSWIERLVQPRLTKVGGAGTCICSLECHVSCKCGKYQGSQSIIVTTSLRVCF